MNSLCLLKNALDNGFNDDGQQDNSKRRHGSSDLMPLTEYENQYYQRLGSV